MVLLVADDASLRVELHHRRVDEVVELEAPERTRRAAAVPTVVVSTIAMRRLSSITWSVSRSSVTGDVIVPPARLRKVSQPPM